MHLKNRDIALIGIEVIRKLREFNFKIESYDLIFVSIFEAMLDKLDGSNGDVGSIAERVLEKCSSNDINELVKNIKEISLEGIDLPLGESLMEIQEKIEIEGLSQFCK